MEYGVIPDWRHDDPRLSPEDPPLKPWEEVRDWALGDLPDGLEVSECWPAPAGAHLRHGYPYISVPGIGTIGAHQYAWSVARGLPGDFLKGAPFHLDHSRRLGCTLSHCVNPHHLEIVTPAENWRRAGILRRGVPKSPNRAKRGQHLVTIRDAVDNPPDECLLLTEKARVQAVYIQAHGHVQLAHRYVMALSMGLQDSRDLPKGLQVDHVAERGCWAPGCCNPAHLELVTASENMKRAHRLNRTHLRPSVSV